jgi:hypothetical protein
MSKGKKEKWPARGKSGSNFFCYSNIACWMFAYYVTVLGVLCGEELFGRDG